MDQKQHKKLIYSAYGRGFSAGAIIGALIVVIIKLII